MKHKSTGYIYINGVALPYPDKESGALTISTMVESARTADGVMRGERVGRDLVKIEMTWNVLEPAEWANILRLLQNFKVTVRYFDMVSNNWSEKYMYCSDRSARPFLINKNTGKPKYYLNCSVNLIDIGG